MWRDVHHPGRSALLLGAGLLTGAVLTGCAGTELRAAPAAATGPVDEPAAATSTPSSGSGAALSSGLLPADAFGSGADAHTFTLADLGSWDHWDHWDHGAPDVVPPACATAMDQLTTQFKDPQDAAGEWVHQDGGHSVEVLAVPAKQVDAVAQARAVAGACSSATVSHDDGDQDGKATVSVAPLSGVPNGMAAFSVTFSATWSGGSWTSTSYVGVAQDGNRVVTLAQMSWHDGSSPGDPASFTALLQHAYQVQSDALD